MKPVVIIVIVVLVLLLVFGEYKLLYQPCESPFERLYSQKTETTTKRCCIDKKGNGVCDDEEEIIEIVKICLSPYIQKDENCCLDENNNNICDDIDMETKCSNVDALEAIINEIMGDNRIIPGLDYDVEEFDIRQSKDYDYNWIGYVYYPGWVFINDNEEWGLFQVCIDKDTCEVGNIVKEGKTIICP